MTSCRLTARLTRTRGKDHALINHRSRAPVSVDVRPRMYLCPSCTQKVLSLQQKAAAMHVDGAICPACRSRIRARLYFLAGVAFALPAILLGTILYWHRSWLSSLIAAGFLCGLTWFVIHAWPLARHPWSNSAPHRDGREASHVDQPSSAPARGRER